MRVLLLTFLVLAITGLAFTPVHAQGKLNSASFSGIVDHVSEGNIKVADPRTRQTLSFLIVPRFDQIFSPDGKTKYRMKAIKPGQYVKIYYDQRMMGQRRADRILLLTQNNTARSRQ